MIDALNLATRLTMAEAAQVVGKSVATVYNWSRPTDAKGRKRKHVLETVRLGGTLYTNRWALRRFQTNTDWRRWYKKRKRTKRRKIEREQSVVCDLSSVASYLEYLQAVTGVTFRRLPAY